MKNSIIKSAITCLLLLSPSTFAATDIIVGEMEFKGVVVAHGCTIVAGDENKVIDFKQISAKDLYSLQKSNPVAFSISLENCSQDIYKSVTITLDGQAHSTMPNHIAVTGSGSEDPKSIGIAFTDKAHNIIELKNQVLLNSLIINEYNLILWPMLKQHHQLFKIKRYSQDHFKHKQPIHSITNNN